MRSRFRLITLGGLSVERDGERVAAIGPQRKVLALLARLAAEGRRGVSRDKLVATLWPDGDDDSGRNALAQVLHRVRRELGAECIQGSGELTLNDTVVSADLLDFKQALAEGDLKAAVNLYRGPFLDGVQRLGSEFERWAEEERNVVRGAYRRALDQLASDAERSGDHPSAVEWLRRLVEIDPTSSTTALRYMDALAAGGSREAAIRHGQVYAALVQTELDAEPEPAVVARADFYRLAQTAGAGASVSQAPAKVGEPLPSRLPRLIEESSLTEPNAKSVQSEFRSRWWRLSGITPQPGVVATAVAFLVGVFALSRAGALRTTGLLAHSAPPPVRSSDVRTRRLASSAFVGGGAGDISPDGRFFYAQSGVGFRQLTRITLSTGAIDTVAQFEGGIDNVRVSRDGRLLAVSVWLDVLPTERSTYHGVSMWVVGTDGSNKRELARPHYVQDFEAAGWLPDSRYIVVTAQRDSGKGSSYTDAIYALLVSVADGKTTKIAEMGTGYAYSTRVSPDGRRIGYSLVDETSGSTRAKVVNIETGKSDDLVDWSDNHQFVDWTTDGRGAYLERQRSNATELWLQRLDNGLADRSAVLLKSELPHIVPVGVSMDGLLHYVVNGNSSDVVTVNVDSTMHVASSPTPVHMHSTRGTLGGLYSPDGKYLAYIALHGPNPIPGNASLVFETLDGSEQREVPLSTGNSTIVNWIAGKSRILVQGADKKGDKCRVFDAVTGTEAGVCSQREPPSMQLGRPAILSDGSVLRGVRDSSAAGRWPDADNSVELHDVSRREDRVLGRVSRMVRMIPSPDGKALVALVQSHGERSLQLYRIDADGIHYVRPLAPITLAGFELGVSSTIWGADNRSIVAAMEVRGSNGWERTAVLRFPLSGAPSEHLFDLPPFLSLSSMHPGGRRFAFVRAPSVNAELWALDHRP